MIQRKVHFGIHPGYYDEARIRHVYLRVHGASGDRDFVGKSPDCAGETTFQRRHLDLYLLADVHRGYGGFRYRKDQAQSAVLRQFDHRHGLCLRCGSRLNHGTGIGVPFGNNSGERSRNPGIVHQRFHFLRVGRINVDLFLGGDQGGLCAGNLRFRDKVFALGFVDLLLRHQPRFLFRYC